MSDVKEVVIKIPKGVYERFGYESKKEKTDIIEEKEDLDIEEER